MKCTNCGFECDNLFCPMCGTKMPEQNTEQVETNVSAQYSEQPQNNDPAMENPYQMPQGFGNNQYGADPVAPAQQVPVYPQQNILPYQGMPVPPQYEPCAKKSGKALPIVLSCIIVAVIIAGTAICVYSSYAFNKSIIDVLSDVTSSDYVVSDYYDAPYDNYSTYYDETIRKTGEASEFDDFKITLKEIAYENGMTSNADSQVYSLKFEVENTSDNAITFYEPYADIYSDEEKTIFINDCELLYCDIKMNENYEFSIDAGEKAEFTMYYKISKDIKSPCWFEIDMSNVDLTGDYYSTYKIEFDNQSANTTEATNEK